MKICLLILLSLIIGQLPISPLPSIFHTLLYLFCVIFFIDAFMENIELQLLIVKIENREIHDALQRRLAVIGDKFLLMLLLNLIALNIETFSSDVFIVLSISYFIWNGHDLRLYKKNLQRRLTAESE